MTCCEAIEIDQWSINPLSSELYSAFLGIAMAVFHDDIRAGMQSEDIRWSAQVLQKGKGLFIGTEAEPERDNMGGRGESGD